MESEHKKSSSDGSEKKKSSLVGNEAKIGLAVIAFLLLVFGFVLFRRLQTSKITAGEKNASQADAAGTGEGATGPSAEPSASAGSATPAPSPESGSEGWPKAVATSTQIPTYPLRQTNNAAQQSADSGYGPSAEAGVYYDRYGRRYTAPAESAPATLPAQLAENEGSRVRLSVYGGDPQSADTAQTSAAQQSRYGATASDHGANTSNDGSGASGGSGYALQYADRTAAQDDSSRSGYSSAYSQQEDTAYGSRDNSQWRSSTSQTLQQAAQTAATYDAYGRPRSQGYGWSSTQTQQATAYGDGRTTGPSTGAAAASSYGSSFERTDDKYTVRPGDSFWVISRNLFGKGEFFKAIAEHNRNAYPNARQLQVGDVLIAPSAEVLRRTYPDLCPKPRQRADVTAQTVSTTGPSGGRIYVVAEGDTLFEIARFELGKAARWIEIYDLNRDVLTNDFDYIRPGTELILPAQNNRLTDMDNVTRRRASPYQR